MIVRLVVVDPHPRDPRRDVIVYQVPENSREYELLTKLLDEAGIEWVLIGPSIRKPRKRKEK